MIGLHDPVIIRVELHHPCQAYALSSLLLSLCPAPCAPCSVL